MAKVSKETRIKRLTLRKEHLLKALKKAEGEKKAYHQKLDYYKDGVNKRPNDNLALMEIKYHRIRWLVAVKIITKTIKRINKLLCGKKPTTQFSGINKTTVASLFEDQVYPPIETATSAFTFAYNGTFAPIPVQIVASPEED